MNLETLQKECLNLFAQTRLKNLIEISPLKSVKQSNFNTLKKIYNLLLRYKRLNLKLRSTPIVIQNMRTFEKDLRELSNIRSNINKLIQDLKR